MLNDVPLWVIPDASIIGACLLRFRNMSIIFVGLENEEDSSMRGIFEGD